MRFGRAMSSTSDKNGNDRLELIIDEVESLTAARASAMNGNEPSDAVRVRGGCREGFKLI